MINKYSRMLVFAIIASVSLAYLIYRELIYPVQEPGTYSVSLMLVMLVGYLGILILATWCMQHVSDRTLTMIVIALLVVACGLQLRIAVGMQLVPDVDLTFILNQNRSMVESGEHLFSDRSYFAFNTNNIGVAIVIYWVFRLANAFGCSNYELAGGVFNVFMNMMTYICAYRIVRRFCNRRVSTVFLLYLVSNPGLYAYASYYYTDTISMGMTTLAVDLFTWAVRTPIYGWKRWILLGGAGFVLLFAFRVRVTSIMILIAAIVYGVLCGHIKCMMKVAVPVLLGMLIATVCYSGLLQYHIDFDTKADAIPWQDFVAMGANPEYDGRYNDADRQETMAQPDHDSMAAYNMQKWKSRVKENGLSGNVRLILNKEAVVWSHGDKQYYQYTHQVKEYTPIFEWITGGYAEYFRNYMLAANAVMLILMLLNVAGAMVLHRSSDWQYILLITWLGAALFYVFWEAHPRQSLSYLVFMSMMALPSMKWLSDRFAPADAKEVA